MRHVGPRRCRPVLGRLRHTSSRLGCRQSMRDVNGTMPLPFNRALDIKLIKLVKEYPILYDTTESKYLNLDDREVVWQKIGDTLNRPAQCCKSRWVNIRDMMRRRIRERLRNPNNKNKYNYKYEDQLSFLFPFFPQDISEISSRRTEDFEVYYEEENPIDPVFVQGDSDTETKHTIGVKMTGDGHKDMDSYIDSSTDPIDVFLMSIGSTLKKLNPYYLNQAKSKIFQVVQDYELQQIVNKDEQQAGGSR